MEIPKVGQIVQLNIPQVLAHCAEHDPDEITKLMDKDYSAETFRLAWALLKTPAEAERIKAESGHGRYWAQVHHVLDHDVRVTSQWYARHLPQVVRYLVDRGLTPIGLSAEQVAAEFDKAMTPKKTIAASPGGARYRKTPVGVAQNAIVRHILGCVGEESFTEQDWSVVKASFDHACAYCGSKRQLVMDHAVPISVEALGEHRLGNLVPACHSCNSTKGEKRYDDYLATLPDTTERADVIRRHMERHDYSPLADALSPDGAQAVRDLIAIARLRVKEVATEAIAAINASTERREGTGEGADTVSGRRH